MHSLEHGAVVIYYDPAKLTDEIRQSLTRLVQAYRNPWASVIVVPNPDPQPEAPFILTAWTKMLKLERYDIPTIRAFLAEYLGRGPENPVRQFFAAITLWLASLCALPSHLDGCAHIRAIMPSKFRPFIKL